MPKKSAAAPKSDKWVNDPERLKRSDAAKQAAARREHVMTARRTGSCEVFASFDLVCPRCALRIPKNTWHKCGTPVGHIVRNTTTADLLREADHWRAREAELEAAIARDEDRRPWYWRPHRMTEISPALERLTRIAARLDIPQWLAEDAVTAIQDARHCLIEEARDRLAHQLEVVGGVREVSRRAW